MEEKSLVCYGASDSEEEQEPNSESEEEKETQVGGDSKTRNFLLESGSGSESSSESESVREEEQDEAAETVSPVGLDLSSETLLPPPFSPSSHKLPPPPLGGSGLGGSSVFANPFRERAEERLNALQKHVPLTLQARPSHIGGRRVCVAYRKDGRCRFGIRCKFAHDSDLQSGTAPPTDPAGSENGPADQTQPSPAPSHGPDSERGEEEEEDSRKRKKNRVGLSDSLVPPKRALKQFAMQKHKM